MNIENTLLKNFDTTVSKLKELNILGDKENRTSIIKEIMRQYIETNNEELKRSEIDGKMGS